jgi:hypothetical protein
MGSALPTIVILCSIPSPFTFRSRHASISFINVTSCFVGCYDCRCGDWLHGLGCNGWRFYYDWCNCWRQFRLYCFLASG